MENGVYRVKKLSGRSNVATRHAKEDELRTRAKAGTLLHSSASRLYPCCVFIASEKLQPGA